MEPLDMADGVSAEMDELVGLDVVPLQYYKCTFCGRRSVRGRSVLVHC